MITRRNVRSLTSDDKKRLVNGLLELKKGGKYDRYVHWHHHVMIPAVYSWEPKDPNYRNGAHRGPSFLPWHREFLLQVEADLRSVDASLSIPYWDWTEDAGNPLGSPLWAEDFMGGDGVSADEWRVATGAFAHKNGAWPVPDYSSEGLPGPGLKRQFGQNRIQSLPTKEDVALALRETFYDTPPYSPSPFTIGFRNRLEGFVTPRGDSRVKEPGSQLHNRVHVWVGGNMLLMTSPDDPVFFLNHCYIDKVWADWQTLQKEDNPDGAPHYAPLTDGPPAQNLNDALKPWTRTIRETLDIATLGYEYEQPTSSLILVEAVREKIRIRSPFIVD